MKYTILFSMMLLSSAILAEDVEGSAVIMNVSPKGERRARPPRDRRKEGAIPGIVTIPYGKTASGERTHLYRIMGQGGVVADFTDYGARLVRLYAPDETADLENILTGFKPSVIECEKAGEVFDVWKMTPIRRPRATGLVFELEGTNETSRVTYWLDAANALSVESSIADTNAVKWASSLRVAPLVNRPLSVKTPESFLSFSTTTNVTEISLRPQTNATQRVEFKFR